MPGAAVIGISIVERKALSALSAKSSLPSFGRRARGAGAAQAL